MNLKLISWTWEQRTPLYMSLSCIMFWLISGMLLIIFPSWGSMMYGDMPVPNIPRYLALAWGATPLLEDLLIAFGMITYTVDWKIPWLIRMGNEPDTHEGLLKKVGAIVFGAFSFGIIGFALYVYLGVVVL